MSSCSTGAVVAGWEPPALSIQWREPIGPADSGYSILFSDFEDDEEGQFVCMHCLVNEHPEIGRALDLARELGQVDFEDGEWVPAPERDEL